MVAPTAGSFKASGLRLKARHSEVEIRVTNPRGSTLATTKPDKAMWLNPARISPRSLKPIFSCDFLEMQVRPDGARSAIAVGARPCAPIYPEPQWLHCIQAVRDTSSSMTPPSELGDCRGRASMRAIVIHDAAERARRSPWARVYARLEGRPCRTSAMRLCSEQGSIAGWPCCGLARISTPKVPGSGAWIRTSRRRRT